MVLRKFFVCFVCFVCFGGELVPQEWFAVFEYFVVVGGFGLFGRGIYPQYP